MRLHRLRLYGITPGMSFSRRRLSHCLATIAVLLASARAWAGTPIGPMPLGEPGGWLTEDDYPRTALVDNKEGIVRFSLEVDPTGKPVACKVEQSSGDEELDTTACNLVTIRARFSPARDGKGRAVAGRYLNSVRWVLPMTLPGIQNSALDYTMVVSEDGSIAECKITRASGYAGEMIARKRGPCDRVNDFEPYRDATGKPVARRVTFSAETKVEAP